VCYLFTLVYNPKVAGPSLATRFSVNRINGLFTNNPFFYVYTFLVLIVNVFTMKMNYLGPKIYTEGVDFSTWPRLTIDDKKSIIHGLVWNQYKKLWDLIIKQKYLLI